MTVSKVKRKKAIDLTPLLYASVSAFALCMSSGLLSQSAYAQTASEETVEGNNQEVNDEEEVDEIVATGIRQSLKDAQQIKRDSDVFTDAVSASDISSLPDRSVTEALQRIPGVSISRFRSSSDPDHFSVEGSGVVVRGLTFVRSELNGRDVFSTASARGLSYSDIAPEMLQSIEVSKNNSADMIEGGLAGTINLVTRKPFDSPGLVIAGSAEANYGDFRQEVTPTISGLVSNRWEMSNGGEFGLLGNFVSSELKSRSDGIQVLDFRPDASLGANNLLPAGIGMRTQNTDRERLAIGAAAQWESPDDTMLATVQFLRSNAKEAWTERTSDVAADAVRGGSGPRPVAGTEFDFDENGLFTNGTITSSNGWRSDGNFNWRTTAAGCADNSGGGCEPRTPIWGMQTVNVGRNTDREYTTTDIGFNFKWTPSDRLSANFDAQYVESEAQYYDASLATALYSNTSFRLNGNDLPTLGFSLPSEDGELPPVCDPVAGVDCSTYLNPEFGPWPNRAHSYYASAAENEHDNEGDELALRADLEWDFGDDDSFFRSIRGGARYAKRDQINRISIYNWGALSTIYDGGGTAQDGPVWLNEAVDGVPNPFGQNRVQGTVVGNSFQEFGFDNFLRGEVANPLNGASRLYPGFNIVENREEFYDLVRLIGSEWGGPATFTPLADRPDLVDGNFQQQEINDFSETTLAVYALTRFGHEFDNGMELSGNVGVRIVETDFTSNGGVKYPPLGASFPVEADCTPPPGRMPPLFCTTYTLEEREAFRAFANGGGSELVDEISYTNVLPSLNMKLDLNDESLIRFGFSQSISRPEIGLVRNYIDVTAQFLPNENGDRVFNGFIGSSGNPTLTPIKSTQFDLSYEWYFAEAGSFTVSGFWKDLKDMHVSGNRTDTLTNNGQTYDVLVTGPTNSGDKGKIKGVEVSYQQFYPQLPGLLGNFGTQLNYTYVNSSGVPRQNLVLDDPNALVRAPSNLPLEDLPLEGLSKHNINAALIYETDKISARAAYSWRSDYLITGRDVIFPNSPVLGNATGQLDGSIFYNLNENWKIGVQGVNLLNEITKTSAVLDIDSNGDLVEAPRSWFMNDRRFSFIARATF